VIHSKTLLISRHFYSLESYVWKSIYNLKIDTISTYDIPLDRSFLKLWNSIRYVMSSTDRRLELKEKSSMAQNAWQASVYATGLIFQYFSTANVFTRRLLSIIVYEYYLACFVYIYSTLECYYQQQGVRNLSSSIPLFHLSQLSRS